MANFTKQTSRTQKIALRQLKENWKPKQAKT